MVTDVNPEPTVDQVCGGGGGGGGGGPVDPTIFYGAASDTGTFPVGCIIIPSDLEFLMLSMGRGR